MIGFDINQIQGNLLRTLTKLIYKQEAIRPGIRYKCLGISVNEILSFCPPLLIPLWLPWCLSWLVKSLPAIWETKVQSLGEEDSLEKEMATYSSILAWRIPWTEEPGGLQFMRSQRVRYNWATEQQPLSYLRKCKQQTGYKCSAWSSLLPASWSANRRPV